MNKLPSYKKRIRAELCAFSPEFRERVKAIRSELGIPLAGFSRDLVRFPNEASNWYKGHIQKTTGKQHKDLPRYYWHFPKEFAELIENFGYSTEPCKAGFHPEVPLDRCAMDLVHEFDLPEDVVNEVKHHIVVEESSSFGVSPMLQPIIIPIEGQDGFEFLALIAGIDGSTTKKEWLDIWGQIQRNMDRYWDRVVTGSTKRDEEKIQIRDLTWWKWSHEGLSLKEIADKWEEGHAGEVYGEDTVRAAIKRIKEVMRPISQNGS